MVQLVKNYPHFTTRSCSPTSSDSMLSRSLLKTNSTVQDVLCTAVHGRRSLLPKSHTVLRYTRRRHFNYTRKKSTAFPARIFPQPTNARQHYVQICCAEFRYDRTANVQTADTTPLMPANKVWLSLHHATYKFLIPSFIQKRPTYNDRTLLTKLCLFLSRQTLPAPNFVKI